MANEDVMLFIPALPKVRKVCERGSAGRLVGYINRRDGTDLFFKKVT